MFLGMEQVVQINEAANMGSPLGYRGPAWRKNKQMRDLHSRCRAEGVVGTSVLDPYRGRASASCCRCVMPSI